MCITNPLKISDFQGNLLHMLLFSQKHAFYFSILRIKEGLSHVQQPLFIGAPGLARGGDDGRLVGEPVADVDIERVAVAAELPVGRHVELVKRDGVAVQD